MINKIKNWIKEYALFIVAILIVTIMVKSCSTSMIERRFTYSTKQYEHIIDSLETTVAQKTDTIYNLRAENDILKGNISDIKRDKEYYMKVNNKLVNVTKKLTE